MDQVVIDQTSATPADHVSKAWREFRLAKQARVALDRRLAAARKTEADAHGRMVRVCQRLALKAGSGQPGAAPALRAAR